MMTRLESELLQALERIQRYTANSSAHGLGFVHDIAYEAITKVYKSLQRDECSHGVRRDLCPDCAPEQLEALAHEVQAQEDAEAEARNHSHIPEQHRDYLDTEPYTHKHNASCYMLGQRQVGYRTCGKLEGEPQ